MVLMQESAAAIALAACAEGPEHLKDAEARLKKLDKELQEERQCVLELPPYFKSRHFFLHDQNSVIFFSQRCCGRYSSTLELMRSRAQEQLTSKKSSIDKLHQEIACHKHDLLLLQKQTDDVQKQQESLNEYLKARGLMNLNPKPPSKVALLHSHTHLLPRPTKR